MSPVPSMASTPDTSCSEQPPAGGLLSYTGAGKPKLVGKEPAQRAKHLWCFLRVQGQKEQEGHFSTLRVLQSQKYWTWPRNRVEHGRDSQSLWCWDRRGGGGGRAALDYCSGEFLLLPKPGCCVLLSHQHGMPCHLSSCQLCGVLCHLFPSCPLPAVALVEWSEVGGLHCHLFS